MTRGTPFARVGVCLKWTGDVMGFNVIRLDRRARPHCLGLMFPMIRRVSPSEIIAKGNGSSATDDAIKGEAESAGLATVYQWSTHSTSSRIVLRGFARACRL